MRDKTIFLDPKYCKFWQNNDCKDSLDEMTTILCSLHSINDTTQVRIGESLFLSNYYNKKIVSWTHYVFEKLEGDNIFNSCILEFPYVQNILYCFGLNTEILTGIIQTSISQKKYKLGNIFRYTYSIPRISFEGYIFLAEKFAMNYKLENLSREDILREIFKEKPKENYEIHAQDFWNYQTINVSLDGNCAFWAVLQAMNPDASFECLSDNQAEEMQTLRQNAANLAAEAQSDSYFVEMLRTPNQWNDVIHGGVGLEALHFIAIVLERRIVLIENEGGNFLYWDANENNLVLHDINANAIGNFLEEKNSEGNTPLFIFHEGNHFQAIIKK